jgi:membrane protease YdiL (CAAX protease family)
VVKTRRGRGGYAELSMRPLTIAVFLLPLIVLYELGSVRYLADEAHGTVETIKAHSILLGFFQDFGVAGRFVPAVTLLTVLLLWHVLNGDSWRPRPAVLVGMVMESVAWTIPLLVLVALVQLLGGGIASAVAAQVTGPALPQMAWQAKVTISLGAGLYEELLFRMIGIAFLHMVFVDLGRMSERWGMALAIVLSAAAFAVYHDVMRGGQLEAVRAFSLLCAGAYFGLVYSMRGFGIVVAVHALYDILVLVVLQAG